MNWEIGIDIYTVTNMYKIEFSSLKCFSGFLVQNLSSFYFFVYLFILFWLRWVFIAARGLSLVAASGGYSLL